MLISLIGSLKNINEYKELFLNNNFDNNYLVIDDISSDIKIHLENSLIFTSDYLIALSDSDTINIYICKLAKSLYNIKYTISLLNNPSNEFLMKKENVDLIICPSSYIKDKLNNFIEESGVIKCL